MRRICMDIYDIRGWAFERITKETVKKLRDLSE